MFRKTLYILSLAVAALVCAPTAGAQMKSGKWTSYVTFGGLNKAVEGDTRNYLLLGPSLFSLSDDDGEAYTFSAANKLSDYSSITGIWYNADAGVLFVAYESGNIDLVYDDGSVFNMADIKDAILTTGRKIRDVAFGHGRIFVATDFGLVVYDLEKHQVIESGIYNVPIDKVMLFGDNIVIITDHSLYVSPYDTRHNLLDSFVRMGAIWFSQTAPLGDDKIVFSHINNGNAYVAQLDFDTKESAISMLNLDGEGALRQVMAIDGGVGIVHGANITVMAPDGSRSTTALPAKYADGTVCIGSTLKSTWVDTDEGVVRLDLEASTPTVLMQPYRPEGLTMRAPAQLVWSADGSRLYFANLGTSYYLSGSIDDGFSTLALTSYLDGSGLHDALPQVVEVDNSPEFNAAQASAATKRIVGGSSRIAVDPDDKGTIYVPTRSGGVFVVKDGKVLTLLNSTNVPYEKSPYREEAFLAAIDQDGNLWFGDGYKSEPTIKVLPAAKRRSKIQTVEKGDWTSFALPSTFSSPNRDYQVTFCRKSDYNFIFYGDYERGLVVMHNNGTPSNFRDDSFIHHQSITDVAGNTLNINHITCVTEDADGKVWVGTNMGLFVIDNPADAMNPTMRVRRPIVPRNDGTQLGDYLLSTEKIYDIAIDPSNRKWVATESSGAYLVSADGTEIIANFNNANSGLPSDCVLSVGPDLASNRVYFGTTLGAACYDSDSSPASDDFSDVYAYPNPVRPEYTGWITIAGLMDKSLVKIADAAGNVFFQGTSEGGMVTWDGCDPSGHRVRTGVYFVFASQNASGSASGVVTKIMVVN